MSDLFDDVYFSNANGVQETQYVFLNNNGLPNRWLQCKTENFVIAETGFGTGLNFLVTLASYLHLEKTNVLPRLHFVSVEKYPLNIADLKQALAHWPSLNDLAEQLIAQYPAAVSGCHRMHFNNRRVTLDLHFGDAIKVFTDMQALQTGLVDAWFLDGFAPSKNPDMWQPDLFKQLSRLSRQACTYATFSAAGVVKRGLRQAGFSVEKRPGFGRKRDMLAGQLIPEQSEVKVHQGYYQRLSKAISFDEVVIIGAGLASACLAYLLTHRGRRVTVLSKGQAIADGASGNLVGGFYPQLHAQFSPLSQCQALSFLYARRFYDELLDSGYEFGHDWCGVLQLAHTNQLVKRLDKLTNSGLWPIDLVRMVDAESASKIADVELEYPALHFPLAGWISPKDLVSTLYDGVKDTGLCKFQLDAEVKDIIRQKKNWQLHLNKQAAVTATNVVLCAGAHSINLPALSALPMRPVRGQVEHLPSQAPLTSLRAVLCHKGYLTPAAQGIHAMGSTYVKNRLDTEVSSEESQTNLSTHQAAMQGSSWFHQVTLDGKARASVRNTTADHQPIVGNVPDGEKQHAQYRELYKAWPRHRYPLPGNAPGLFVLTGLGSRGLTTAPLMAQLLVSQMLGEPLPLTGALLDALNPNRFLVRQLIRGN